MLKALLVCIAFVLTIAPNLVFADVELFGRVPGKWGFMVDRETIQHKDGISSIKFSRIFEKPIVVSGKELLATFGIMSVNCKSYDMTEENTSVMYKDEEVVGLNEPSVNTFKVKNDKSVYGSFYRLLCSTNK